MRQHIADHAQVGHASAEIEPQFQPFGAHLDDASAQERRRAVGDRHPLHPRPVGRRQALDARRKQRHPPHRKLGRRHSRLAQRPSHLPPHDGRQHDQIPHGARRHDGQSDAENPFPSS
jgi:hypothetical protein